MTKTTPLYTLFFTSLVSVTGNMMSAVAIPWFVLQTTGSPAQAGITAFFSVLPIVIAGALGGTLIDRVGYKRISVLADFFSGLTMLLIPVLHLTVGLQFWQLLVLVFLGNLLDAPGQAARTAMLPELAQAASMKLERATGITQVISRSTMMVGAPLSGLLIALTSAPIVLVINAATFLISAVGIQLFIPADIHKVEKQEEPVSYWQDLRAGFQFVREDRLIFTIVMVVMITNMIDEALFGLTLPVFARDIYGDVQSLGAMVGVFGASAVLGTLIYSRWGTQLPKRWLFTVCFILLSLRFFLFMLLPPLWLMLVFIGVTGLACGPLNPIIDVFIFERVPQQMRARVFGFITAGVLIAIPVGAVVAGYMLEWLGLVPTLFIFGLIYLVTTSSLIFLPAMREMDEIRLDKSETQSASAVQS